jgi:allantoicase
MASVSLFTFILKLMEVDHPSLVLDATLDLACVETQISTGVAEPDARDCELLEWPTGEAFGRVSVPALQ